MILEFWWIGQHDPVPDGWRLCDNRSPCIHHHYGKVLIFREVKE